MAVQGRFSTQWARRKPRRDLPPPHGEFLVASHGRSFYGTWQIAAGRMRVHHHDLGYSPRVSLGAMQAKLLAQILLAELIDERFAPLREPARPRRR